MKTIALATSLVLWTGCMVGRDYQAPAPALPGSYSSFAPEVSSTSSVDLAEWWTVFGDDSLSNLIREAANSNLDLKIAVARVREARALRGVQRSALFPEVNAQGQYSRQRSSEKSFAGRQLAAAGQPPESDLFEAGLDMNWEIDVFGGRRRALQAAQAEWEASVESVHDARTTVLAEVALNYLDHRGTQKEIEVVRRNLRAQEETLALTRDRFQAGLSGELDVARAEAQASRTRSQIPPLEEASQRAIYRIGVLLGQAPLTFQTELSTPAPLPQHPPRVPVGLPSDLLRQRPDIRRSERELAAASAEVAAATAEWYPRFFLTGAAGLQSIQAEDLLTSGARFWSIGPGIQWPIFNAGRIRQNVRVRGAREEQALLRYERTLLVALEETEGALLAFGKEQERFAALADSEASQRRSVALANDRYRGGLADFLEVLEAERTLLAAQGDLVQSERRLAQNLVRLFKALGGGWPFESRDVIKNG